MLKLLFSSVFTILILAGCSSSYIIYEPSSSTEVSVTYTDGISYATCATDSNLFTISVKDKKDISGDDYMCVWFLFQNYTQEPFELEPWTVLNLKIVDTSNNEVFNIAPANPGQIIKRIEQQESVSTFFNALFGTLLLTTAVVCPAETTTEKVGDCVGVIADATNIYIY